MKKTESTIPEIVPEMPPAQDAPQASFMGVDKSFYYTCPSCVPSYAYSQRGNCPKCGQTLVGKRRQQ
jgi:hypothetical protein